MASCKTSVPYIYNHIIEDVISSLQDDFVDEGIDVEVLQELKRLWKLKTSKVISNSENSSVVENLHESSYGGTQEQQTVASSQKISKVISNSENSSVVENLHESFYVETQEQQTVASSQRISKVISNSENSSVVENLHELSYAETQEQQIVASSQAENTLIPVEVTLPNDLTQNSERVLTIHIPKNAFSNILLLQMFTSPVIESIMGLPNVLAACFLQGHIDNVLKSQQQSVPNELIASQVEEVGSTDFNSKKISIREISTTRQSDGPTDSSDEDETSSIDIPSSAYVTSNDELLNSEDDVTDEESCTLFDANNVVCMFSKIVRDKNHWKFYLEKGIMHLAGEDFVFCSASGDAKW